MPKDFPFVAGDKGLRLEDERRYCRCGKGREGVVADPLAVLRLEDDLLVLRLGVCCRSPRYELATEGDLEGGRGETDEDMDLFLGAGVLYAERIGEEGGSGIEAGVN